MNTDLKRRLDMVKTDTYDESANIIFLEKVIDWNDRRFEYSNLDMTSKNELIYLAYTCESAEVLRKMLLIKDDIIKYALIENPKTPADILNEIKNEKLAQKARIEEMIFAVDCKVKVNGYLTWLNDDDDDD